MLLLLQSQDWILNMCISTKLEYGGKNYFASNLLQSFLYIIDLLHISWIISDLFLSFQFITDYNQNYMITKYYHLSSNHFSSGIKLFFVIILNYFDNLCSLYVNDEEKTLFFKFRCTWIVIAYVAKVAFTSGTFSSNLSSTCSNISAAGLVVLQIS